MGLLPSKFYDDFFDDFSLMPKMPKDHMKCDIYEEDGNVFIEVDIPGFSKEDVKIDLDDGILTIQATKTNEKEENNKNYYRKERTYGTFKRQFNVGNIEGDKIEANFNNGVLNIKFPKEIEKQTKKFIDIK